MRADPGEELKSVHPGHVQVQEDNVRKRKFLSNVKITFAERVFGCFLAIANGVDVRAGLDVGGWLCDEEGRVDVMVDK